MPRELIATAPRTPELREYEEPPLGPTQIRIKTEFASPKHGTELVGYRNDPVANRPYDFAWGANIPRPPDVGLQGFPRPLGNMAVGTVVEVGPEVTRFDVGMEIRRLTGPTPDPTPRAQTRITGGYLERPTQTGQLGVDVAVETSGSVPALHQAIRATRFGGTICMISFYGKDATGLYLGDEFHVNRLTLVSARAETLPGRDAPVWDLKRLVDLALSWLVSGRMRADGIVTPIVDFADSAEAYRAIDERPQESIKLGIRFQTD